MEMGPTPAAPGLERSSNYGWFVVVLLWVAAMLNYLDRQAIFSLFPLLRKDLRMSNLALGLVGSVFLWVYGGLSPFVGYLGDRFSRRNIIVATLALWSLVTFATGFARTSAEVIALRGLMGICEACYMPAALTLISDYQPPARRSTAVGLHQTGIYFGAAIGGSFAGYVAEHWGWRRAFHSLGAFGVLFACFLWASLREAPRGARDPLSPGGANSSARPLWASLRVVLRSPTLLVLSAVVLVFSIYFWALTAWLPLFFFEKFGMGLARAGGIANAYVQAASVLGIGLGGPLADFAMRREVRARMAVQVAGLLIPAPFLLMIGQTHSLVWAVVALLAFGLGRGLWDCNNMPVICDVVAPAVRSTAYGVFNFAGMLGGGIGTLGFGLLVKRAGSGTLFSAACPLAVLAAVIAWVGMKRFLLNDMRSLRITLQAG
jgi:MFS transporter, Spinster family, sphingosine-1-phosphate transporter